MKSRLESMLGVQEASLRAAQTIEEAQNCADVLQASLTDQREEAAKLHRKLAASEEQRDLAVERLATSEQLAEQVREQLQVDERRRRAALSTASKAVVQRKTLAESTKGRANSTTNPSAGPACTTTGLFAAAGRRTSWGSLKAPGAKVSSQNSGRRLSEAKVSEIQDDAQATVGGA